MHKSKLVSINGLALLVIQHLMAGVWRGGRGRGEGKKEGMKGERERGKGRKREGKRGD